MAEDLSICADLYLFEQVLRNDPMLIESERLRRWNRRMRWEEMSTRTRQEQWQMMSPTDRGMLGIDVGGWWAYRLRMTPLDTTYGHQKELVGPGGLLERHNSGFRRGKYDAHYPLSSKLKCKYPFWRDGGFGVGRSLIRWLEELSNPETRPDARSGSQATSSSSSSSVIDDKAIQALVEARHQVDLKRQKEEELMARKMAAQYRRAHLVASVQAQASVPLSASELALNSSYAPPGPEYGVAHPFHRQAYPHHGSSWPRPDPYSHAYHHPHPHRNPHPGAPAISAAQRADATHPSGPSNHRPVAGLPWGSLLSELRRRDGRRADRTTNSERQPDPSHSQGDRTRRDAAGSEGETKGDGGGSRNDEGKRTASERMESMSSITSQVPAPPAYQPSSNGSGAKVGLPKPPTLYKAKDLDRTGWGQPMPGHQPTTRDV